jgi:CheY-like chemotaxis protein
MRPIGLGVILMFVFSVVSAQNPNPNPAPKADPKAAAPAEQAAGVKRVVDPNQAVSPRYDVMLNTRTYKQATAQDTLTAVVRAIESKRYDVLVAHLIEPSIADARIAERARQLEPALEVELIQTRARQKADPNPIPRSERVPYEPPAFAAFVKDASILRGFRTVVADVQAKYDGDPTALAELKRYLRSAQFTGDDTQQKATLADVKGKAIFFKSKDGRWFMDDRQEDLPTVK